MTATNVRETTRLFMKLTVTEARLTAEALSIEVPRTPEMTELAYRLAVIVAARDRDLVDALDSLARKMPRLMQSDTPRPWEAPP